MNIASTLGSISVFNSTFTDGKMHHILAQEQSQLNVDQVTIKDSRDDVVQGHGIVCSSCTGLTIQRSTFRNLTAHSIPAIFIENQMGVESYIDECTFENNVAWVTSGSLRVEEAGIVYVSNSKFISNQVIKNVNDSESQFWRYSDAGAIYFKCNPLVTSEKCEVILDNNLFEGNFAENKGGALRYINRNFTTAYNHSKSGRRVLSDRDLQNDDLQDTNNYRSN